MSVRDRIDEGHLLFMAGKLEGALITTCVAIAATSRKRYPDRVTHVDRQAFEQFLIDERPKYLSGNEYEIEFHGEMRPLENILYKFVRNCLIHESELEEHISFEYGDFLLDKRGTTEYFTFSSELVLRLMWIVETAPENEGVFPTGVLDRLAEPIDLIQFMDISYEFDDHRHRLFCSACSIVDAAPEPGETPVTWLHFKGIQTFDGQTLHGPTVKIIVPTAYVTNAIPGPKFQKTRSRPTSTDVGVMPVGKSAPDTAMALEEIKQVVNALQVPMVRSVVTLHRPYYDVTSIGPSTE